jgi:hypothetical protein
VIELEGIVLGAQCPALDNFLPLDLSGLVYCPQTALPGSSEQPPPRNPYRIDYAPGTLSWPLGASRFSVGQFLASEFEVEAIRAQMVGTDPVPLTLKLGHVESGQVEAEMYVLTILPLQVNRSELVNRVASGAFYLVVLVDGRYFFQTNAPDWTPDDVTNWVDMDTEVLAYLDEIGLSASTADEVPTAYLFPGASLFPPAYPSMGSPTWSGSLLDAICEASGRKFVSNLDGSFKLQNWTSAELDDTTNQGDNEAYQMTGGILAFPPESTSTVGGAVGLYTVPRELSVVFPGRTETLETAPLVSTQTFADVRDAAGYAADAEAIYEDDLRVLTGLWWDSTNTTQLEDYATQWATDWYAWLRGPCVLHYAGICPVEPNGYVDQIVWCVRREAVYTKYYRGFVNPRPLSVIGGLSAVEPLGPTFVDVTIINATFEGDLYFDETNITYNQVIAVYIAGEITYNETIFEYNETTHNYYDSHVTYNNTTNVTFEGNTYIFGTFYQQTYLNAEFETNINNFNLLDTAIRYKIAFAENKLELSGLVPGTNPSGRLIYLYNVGSKAGVIPHLSESSTEGNRIITPTGNDLWFPPTAMVCLCYDLDVTAWRISESSHMYCEGTRTYDPFDTDVDNWDIDVSKNLHRISADGGMGGEPVRLEGVKWGVGDLKHRLVNVGGADIYIPDQAGTADGENQFLTPNGMTFTFYAGEVLEIVYDGVAQKWRPMRCECLHLYGTQPNVPWTTPPGLGPPVENPGMAIIPLGGDFYKTQIRPDPVELKTIIELWRKPGAGDPDSYPDIRFHKRRPPVDPEDPDEDLESGDELGGLSWFGKVNGTEITIAQDTTQLAIDGDDYGSVRKIYTLNITGDGLEEAVTFSGGKVRPYAVSGSTLAYYDVSKGLSSITTIVGATLDGDELTIDFPAIDIDVQQIAYCSESTAGELTGSWYAVMQSPARMQLGANGEPSGPTVPWNFPDDGATAGTGLLRLMIDGSSTATIGGYSGNVGGSGVYLTIGGFGSNTDDPETTTAWLARSIINFTADDLGGGIEFRVADDTGAEGLAAEVTADLFVCHFPASLSGGVEGDLEVTGDIIGDDVVQGVTLRAVNTSGAAQVIATNAVTAVGLAADGSSNSGYIQWINVSGTRTGYMGSVSNNNIQIVCEPGSNDVQVQGGSIIIDELTASQLVATDADKKLVSVAPDTGWSTSGGTPSKTFNAGSPTAAANANAISAIITALIAKGIFSA